MRVCVPFLNTPQGVAGYSNKIKKIHNLFLNTSRRRWAAARPSEYIFLRAKRPIFKIKFSEPWELYYIKITIWGTFATRPMALHTCCFFCFFIVFFCVFHVFFCCVIIFFLRTKRPMALSSLWCSRHFSSFCFFNCVINFFFACKATYGLVPACGAPAIFRLMCVCIYMLRPIFMHVCACECV